jgi:hypothetical protein
MSFDLASRIGNLQLSNARQRQMTYSILIRDLGKPAGRNEKLLAVDIASPLHAGGIVERIAASYPENGRCRLSQMRWFRDEGGLHEIWAEPHADCFIGGRPPVNASAASRSLRGCVTPPDQTRAGSRVLMSKVAYACST